MPSQAQHKKLSAEGGARQQKNAPNIQRVPHYSHRVNPRHDAGTVAEIEGEGNKKPVGPPHGPESWQRNLKPRRKFYETIKKDRP